MVVGIESCKTELFVKALNLITQRISHYRIRGQMLIDFASVLFCPIQRTRTKESPDILLPGKLSGLPQLLIGRLCWITGADKSIKYVILECDRFMFLDYLL